MFVAYTHSGSNQVDHIVNNHWQVTVSNPTMIAMGHSIYGDINRFSYKSEIKRDTETKLAT